MECPVCKKIKHLQPYKDKMCGECQRIQDAANKKVHLDSLKKLPIEERVAKIEEWIYDYKPEYVYPPTFG